MWCLGGSLGSCLCRCLFVPGSWSSSKEVQENAVVFKEVLQQQVDNNALLFWEILESSMASQFGLLPPPLRDYLRCCLEFLLAAVS